MEEVDYHIVGISHFLICRQPIDSGTFPKNGLRKQGFLPAPEIAGHLNTNPPSKRRY